MTLTKPYVPTAELVLVQWARRQIPALAASIATGLPDLATGAWPDDIFITIHEIPGALADRDVSQRQQSLFSVDFWAAKKDNAVKALWPRAAQAAMVFREALDAQPWGGVLDLGADYRDARVQAVYADQQPWRVDNDPNGYARYTLTTRCDWIALPAA